jgi:uncharacterized membrane protein YqjE
VENAPAQLVQVTGLAKRLAQRLLVICENKVELLVVEVQEARQRLLHAALLAVAMTVLGLMAVLAITAAIVVMLWETSPVIALLVLSACYAAGAFWLYRRLTILWRDWEILPNSLGELRKDCECLEQRLN